MTPNDKDEFSWPVEPDAPLRDDRVEAIFHAMKPQTTPNVVTEVEVILHSMEGFDATRRTIEMLPGCCTLERRPGNRFFIVPVPIAPQTDVKFVAWACQRQGYVKEVLA